MRNDTGRVPHVWLRIDEWIDAYEIIKGCALPAARAGSTLHFQVESAMVLQPLYHLGNPHYSMFHECSGAIISTMHIDQRHVDNSLTVAIDVIQLFHTLAAMPSLLDLAMRLDNIPHLTRRTKTPVMPFRLRRLELWCVFRGWARLIAQSGETLSDLTLGEPGAFVVQAEANLDSNDLALLRSVTRLRLHSMYGARLSRACPKLRILEVTTRETCLSRGGWYLSEPIEDAQRPLQSLVLGFQPTQIGLAFWDVIDLLDSQLPALAALRCLTVQAYSESVDGFQDMLATDNEGLAARAALEDVCRRRRVALSIH